MHSKKETVVFCVCLSELDSVVDHCRMHIITSTAYMAVLLGLSGSKVMISMWIRPDRIKKKSSILKSVSESILTLSHQVLMIFNKIIYSSLWFRLHV